MESGYRTRIILVGLAVAIFADIGPLLTRTSKKGASAPRPAPSFEADLLAGGKFSLAEHRGRHVVLLDFWASWCGPCRLAMPALIDLAEEYKDREVVYYAVNLREDRDAIKGFLKQLNWNIQVPLDERGEIAEKFGIEGIPTVILVDKQGVIRLRQVGYTGRLKADLKQALEENLRDTGQE